MRRQPNTTAPRGIRNVPAPLEQEISPDVAALIAALESNPFSDDGDDTPDALTMWLEAQPQIPAPVDELVPKPLHAAMHRFVLDAGDLSQQSTMELAVTLWLGWNPAEFNPRIKSKTLASGRERYRNRIGDPRTPSTAALRERVQAAHLELLESPAAPAAQRVLGAALDALTDRLAETAAHRRARMTEPAAIPGEATTDAPALLNDTDTGPPGSELPPAALTRRANLEVRPTLEQLMCGLAIAPGAPSFAVCV